MNQIAFFTSRRRFLTGIGGAAVTIGLSRLFERGVFAEELQRRIQTPQVTEGPFYPDHLPLDTDNDLLIVNDSITPAVGEVTHLGGRILDSHGDAIRNATIEIWQVDHDGSYLHSHGLNPKGGQRDKNFQGYGRFMTGSTGEYYFRTIKPVPYPGRTPHIHVKVKIKGRDELTTQIFVRGEPLNERDGIFREVADPAAREAILTEFAPLPGSKVGELSARFDIVLGYTPEA